MTKLFKNGWQGMRKGMKKRDEKRMKNSERESKNKGGDNRMKHIFTKPLLPIEVLILYQY